ncbi:hypothetical protein K431DRAFT_216727 [Polychaeton citri CBS 116435]|uniref:Uncharacterized protein n=1 Tax=Polychaeton citri CBS 116435 TaxID=1314669 RepID=A0A9P4QEM4_9PEZI|nr:hypothetical protein K431DRAFT_216727 [Polychaeton citri CBS 116435]
MAPIIWGLDLAEIQWSKFANSNMWNNKYHLRRTKFIVYQLAMIFCVVSESLGTAALSNYLDAQNFVWRHNNRAVVHNNNYIGAASYNIFAGVFNAFIFGAAFFFDLFWPERYESKNVRIAWKVCAVLATVFVCASAFTLTIITATQEAYISGVPAEVGRQINEQFHKAGGAPLKYRNCGRALAAVVFIWPGFVCTFARQVNFTAIVFDIDSNKPL